MNKVVRDGKVAVLYSPGFGAGWYSWNNYKECLFLPEIVELVEQNRRDEITEELMFKLLGGVTPREEFSFYHGGAYDLEIAWLPEGTHFDIHEYDGNESIQTFNDIKLIA